MCIRDRVTYTKENVTAVYNHSFEGEINNLRSRYMETNSDTMKAEIEKYMSDNPVSYTHL